MKTSPLIFVLLILCCSCRSLEDKQIKTVLYMAGDNKTELQSVLNHYENDPEKSAAARFLIANMLYNFSIEEYFQSPNGQTYYPDITRFADADAVRAHCDSLQSKGWHIHSELVYDYQQLKADQLIRNIDLAFMAWSKPWAKEVPFADFCRYILPYRAQNEPLSDRREADMQRFIPFLDSAKVSSPLDACRLLNERLGKMIKYQETGNPLRATLTETALSGIGTCDALCNYTTMVMRAVGIPVAIHQTTWTRMDRGHVWCAVLSKGKFLDFNPGDGQPDEYRNKLASSRFLKPAKVYRRHFDACQTDQALPDDGYITPLKNPLFTDATSEEQTPTYTLTLPVRSMNKDKERSQAYLCAYNYYEWTPIAMGERTEDTCVFRHVAGRNFFIVAEATGKYGLRFISAPFLTDSIGQCRFFRPDTTHRLSQTFKKKPQDAPRTLYYWDTDEDCFKPLAHQTATDTTAHYNNIPDNALLWYAPDKRTLGQRIGIIENGEFKKNFEF